MQERSAASRWMNVILCVGALLAAPVLALAGPSGGAGSGKPVSIGKIASQSTDEDASPTYQTVTYSRTVAWWPYTTGPFYGEVTGPNDRASDVVYTPAGTFRIGKPLAIPAELAGNTGFVLGKSGRNTQYFLVQLRPSALDSDFWSTLTSMGLAIVEENPVNALIVRADRSAFSLLQSSPLVQFMEPYHPAYKIHPSVGTMPQLSAEAAASPIFTLGLRVFPGEPVGPISDQVVKLGGEVLNAAENVGSASFLTVRAHATLIPAFARIEGVSLITEENPKVFLGARGPLFMQSETGTVGDFPYWKAGLDGDNQVLEVSDSGVSVDAGDFADQRSSSGWNGGGGGAGCNVLADHRKVRCYRPANDFGGSGNFQTCDSGSAGGFTHGQIVSGVAIGNATRGVVPTSTAPSPTDDPNESFPRAFGAGWYLDNDKNGIFSELNDGGKDGVGKGAKLVMVDTQSTCPEPEATNPGNLQTTIEQTLSQYGATVHNFSFGSNAGTTGPVCNSGCQQIDTAVINRPISKVFIAAGNAGRAADRGFSGTAGNISNEAVCKNCVSVGASNGLTSHFSFTSHGPGPDRRVLPTVFAEGFDDACRGEEGGATAEDQLGGSSCQDASSQGTSFASPNLAGAATVVSEYFANGFYPDGSDKNATNASDLVPRISGRLVKALMVAGTKPITGGRTITPTDRFNNIWGYGIFHLTRALPLADAPQTVPGLIVHDLPGDLNSDGTDDGVSSLSLSPTIGTTNGETQTADFQVLDTKNDLAVALVWDDPANSTGAVNNNLNLEVRYCGADQACGNADDRVFQGNNFAEDWDRDGSSFDDIDNDGTNDGYFYSLSTKQITDDGNTLSNYVDTKNNTEAVFIPRFQNAPDRDNNGSADLEALANSADGTVTPKTGLWRVSVIRGAANGGTSTALRYSVAIAGPVSAGSSARFDTNPIVCNGDVKVVVNEVADGADTSCTNANTCPPSVIAGRTIVEVLNAANTVVDTQTGLTFTQSVNGGTNLLRYESGRLPLSSDAAPANNDGVLSVQNGQRLRVRYTDQPGAKERVSFSTVDCQPDLDLGLLSQLGPDSFVTLVGGCDQDNYIDAGENFGVQINFFNVDPVNLVDATISMRAVTPDGDNATDPCRLNNASHPNLTVLNGSRDFGVVPAQTNEVTTFSLRTNGTPAARTKAELVFGMTGAKSGQQVQDCVAVSVLLQADDEKHRFITDCPTGCTLNYDINNDEKFEDRVTANQFDVFDVVHRNLDENAVVFENMTVNNTSAAWVTGLCSVCGNAGFNGPWDFDADNEGFRSGRSPQSVLAATSASVSNWGEDTNWNGVLDTTPTNEDQNNNKALDQNWSLAGGCGWMSSNGSNRGVWKTGTVGTYAVADDTTVCRPNDTKCEQYDDDNGTTGAAYWFETLRTPVIHPTRFGTDPDGFAWRSQILDWGWNQQLDFPDSYAVWEYELDLDTADAQVQLGDDFINLGLEGNQLGAISGGQTNLYFGAHAFTRTAQKNEANYGDGFNTARGGNRTGRRGCFFNDLNTIPEAGASAGGRTAAERAINFGRPDDDDCDNDFTLGSKGCPGNCGVDDDSNGIVDDIREICPCKKCATGPRAGAACIAATDCNPDGSLTHNCADATVAGVPTGLGSGAEQDVCGDGSIDENVAATWGPNTGLHQIRNFGADKGVNGVGGVGVPVGDIRFNTLEDFYGNVVGNSWQGEVGFVTFEGSGEDNKQGYGMAVDDMVVEWQEVHPVAQAASACAGGSFNGSCAVLNMASEFDTRDGDGEVQVTVVDGNISAGDNLIDCDGINGADNVQIEAWSEAEPVPELFCLVQTGAGTNTFTGKIRSTTRINKAADKQVYLAVNGADNPSITARYIDKNDGVHGTNPGADGQPGIAGFDDDADGTNDNGAELCPTKTNLAPGRTPHQPGQKAKYSDDNCGCPDNPILAVTLTRFDSADVKISDVIVRDTAVSGVGNGDNDRWADPGEVVNLDVVLKNFSTFPIDDAILTIATDSPNVACLIDNEIRVARIPERSPSNGTPGTVDTSTGTDHFAFRAASVTRSSVNQDLSSTFTLSMRGLGKGGPAFVIATDLPIFGTRIVQTFKVDHNLSATAGTPAADYFENFESYTTDAGMFANWPRFSTGDQPAELEGTRCQVNDPSNPFGNNVDVNFFCELGEGFNNAENHWHLHGPGAAGTGVCENVGCLDGGRSANNPDSACPGGGCRKSMASGNIIEGDTTPVLGDKLTSDANRMTWAETQTSKQLGTGRPELSYWTEMSIDDGRIAGLPADFSLDAARVYVCVDKNGNDNCDTKETGDLSGSENWEPQKSYFNPEASFRRNNFINCSYDPSDDGNTENEFFQNQVDVGPSSTCFPQAVDTCAGRTRADDTTGQVYVRLFANCYSETRVIDDPNISRVGVGPGRWVQKKYRLDSYRGKRVLVRFHISPFGWPGIEHWSQFGPSLGNRDDGWFVDDVRITGIATGVTLSTDNADKGGAACPATNCDTVDAKAAAIENPRNDSNGRPKKASGCSDATVDACDYDSDGTVDTATDVAPSAAPGHAFVLDGDRSTANRCLNGTLEYRWGIQGGAVIRDFLTDPQVVVNPATTTTYELTVRCSSAPACSNVDTVTISTGVTPCSYQQGSLLISSNKQTITWTGSGTFDVAKGNIAQIPTWSAASCLQNNTSTPTATDAATPAANAGFYYTVRCDGGSGPTSYTDGTETGSRTITACP